ncbi:MAG: type III glutamate--ammonia ligase [Rhodoferax sp.]|uniref:type III glutamate--ammonia ligase n=1 Tax=Rhodoferax sp. TaxID=50421 RepID=UPI0026167CDD|nr:type III glutamate--ammonia ligase [Rhodoferax sp.]MDD5335059.1 type III glutamate--ammonia ligase [Rhodoferax sp.]
MSIESTIEALAARGIHSVLTQFSDMHGVAKGKLVPLQNLREWVHSGAGFAGPSIWGTGLGRFGKRSEYYGRVQLESLRPLPFMPGVAHAVCDGYAGGEALATCSRQLLKRQLERLKERGWTLWVGIEPEFFLLRQDQQGHWLAADGQDRLDKPSYDLKSIHRNRGFLEDMRLALTELGFDLQQMDHEDACGQYEINYRFDAALAAADRYMLFKLTAHAIAEKHGMTFSCMPKPFANAPGSGLHFHLSVTDAQGLAVFTDDADAHQLSVQGYRFVAGLLHHADGLSALCAPTVNSYKRLACSSSASGTTWSPVWKSYGENNRTCLVRTVAGRIEWRLPDPSCNVYAAIAATLAAGLNGIDQGMLPPPACDTDLYQCQAAGAPMPARLPRDLGCAIEALAIDHALTSALGEAFCDEFIKLKRQEWDEYSQQVGAWEMRRYADAF